MNALPVVPAHLLEATSPSNRWLVQGLWADQAVGIIGGEPKSHKSLMALELAVSVAAGTPCLRRFQPQKTGRVLLYAAEDSLPVVRERLEGICRTHQIELPQLDIQVITAPSLHLDSKEHRDALLLTVEAQKPRVLILDPFVRLHRGIDENASAEVAPLLAYLRELQRRFQLAVVLVHHARKGGRGLRPGQSLRGSSEFHAWGDSNLYLRRRGDVIDLTAEHRAAAGFELALTLAIRENGISLCPLDTASEQQPIAPALVTRVEQLLAQADKPLPFKDLRKACHTRTAHLCRTLADLTHAGRVLKVNGAYHLA